jgi:hypothetical protein
MNIEQFKFDFLYFNSIYSIWSNSCDAFQEVVPDWQNAASGLLVALGAQYCDEVMSEMFDRFQPGTLPHYFVVRTIGNLAQANGNYRHLRFVHTCDPPARETESTAFETLSRPPEKN